MACSRYHARSRPTRSKPGWRATCVKDRLSCWDSWLRSGRNVAGRPFKRNPEADFSCMNTSSGNKRLASEKTGYQKGDDAEEQSGRWLISYADLITTLMVLFLALYALQLA